MAYSLVKKDPTISAVTAAHFVTDRLSNFPALKHNMQLMNFKVRMTCKQS